MDNRNFLGFLAVLFLSFIKVKSDETYDAIVLGSGIKECLLSLMLSKDGNKVFHIDRNNYYGSELNYFTPLDKLFIKFNVPYSENQYGRGRDWNVDSIPKFIESNGKFVKLLANIGLTQYLQLKSVDKFTYNDSKITKVPSSLLFPMYGVGEMVQTCAKLSKVVLNKSVDEVISNANGVEVKSGSDVFKAKQIFCDPSYVPTLVKKTKQIVRAICLQNVPVADTRNALSAQIIVPQKESGRKNDIYISFVGSQHQVAFKDKFIATISTTVESGNPEEDIIKGIKIDGQPIQKFVSVTDYYEPVDNGVSSKIFISKSYDETVDFEAVGEDVLEIFKRATLKDFDLSSAQVGGDDEDF